MAEYALVGKDAKVNCHGSIFTVTENVGMLVRRSTWRVIGNKDEPIKEIPVWVTVFKTHMLKKKDTSILEEGIVVFPDLEPQLLTDQEAQEYIHHLPIVQSHLPFF